MKYLLEKYIKYFLKGLILGIYLICIFLLKIINIKYIFIYEFLIIYLTILIIILIKIFFKKSILNFKKKKKKYYKEYIHKNIYKNFNRFKFIKIVKKYFYNLQLLWDKMDIMNIKKITKKNFYKKIKIKLKKRNKLIINITKILSIDAEILNIEKVNNEYLINVKIFGFLKENYNKRPIQFQEIWNFSKIKKRNWLILNIQQI